MNLLHTLKKSLLTLLTQEFSLSPEMEAKVQIELNVDKPKTFGDLNCNAAMMLAKAAQQPPRKLAEQIKEKIEANSELSAHIEKIEIAGPGFINLHLAPASWQQLAQELYAQPKDFFKLPPEAPFKKYLFEYVSANPTGPLHLGHGRNGIIGDVMTRILNFLGHTAHREFYINDAGVQMKKLAISLKIRCQQELGQDVALPEDCYAGDYMIDLAKECLKEHGEEVVTSAIATKDDAFFQEYGREKLLEQIKQTLDSYGITFDNWFSELTLHEKDIASGASAIDDAINLLKEKNLMYEDDGALWFKATEFGDDKDRVIRKKDGTLTYIAADIAYHKNKFERGYDVLVNVLGQDHHGYVMRLKATMQALGFEPPENTLDVILYQLVSLKQGGEQIKMSKRAGTFEKLEDVIEKVGIDVARFFYLNRKADTHLDFDLDIALKKTEENPVYYIQYAYVRTNSLLTKAAEQEELAAVVDGLQTGNAPTININDAEIDILKKICSLSSVLKTIGSNYQTHLLCYYTLELARCFHNYYAGNKIIDLENLETTKTRLFITKLTQQTVALCLDLLGLGKPKRM